MEIEELLKLTAERCKNANGDYPPPHLVRQVVEMCERAGVSPLEPWVYLIPRKGKRMRMVALHPALPAEVVKFMLNAI